MDKSRMVEAIKVQEAMEAQQHDPIGTPVLDALLETICDMIKIGIAAHEEKYHSKEAVEKQVGKVVKKQIAYSMQ